MLEALAAIFAVFVWWVATGAAVVAARRADGRERLALGCAGVIALASAYGAYVSAGLESVAGAYLGFLSAIGVWSLPEMAFLIGAVTGPNAAPCPDGVAGGRRFRLAFAAIRDHEFAIAACGLVVIALAWGGPNHTAALTYMLLWTMRISTKLNIYLGAPNAISVLLPRRLAYLNSYFRTDRTSAFFPISLLGTALAFGALCYLAGAADTSAAATGWSLLAAFAALGLLEHVFLAAPISDSALWGWALPSSKPTPNGDGATDQTNYAKAQVCKLPAHASEH